MLQPQCYIPKCLGSIGVTVVVRKLEVWDALDLGPSHTSYQQHTSYLARTFQDHQHKALKSFTRSTEGFMVSEVCIQVNQRVDQVTAKRRSVLHAIS